MNKYCYFCKALIQEWDKFKITEKGYIHNTDDKDCYAMSTKFIDDCGWEITDEYNNEI